MRRTRVTRALFALCLGCFVMIIYYFNSSLKPGEALPSAARALPAGPFSRTGLRVCTAGQRVLFCPHEPHPICCTIDPRSTAISGGKRSSQRGVLIRPLRDPSLNRCQLTQSIQTSDVTIAFKCHLFHAQ